MDIGGPFDESLFVVTRITRPIEGTAVSDTPWQWSVALATPTLLRCITLDATLLSNASLSSETFYCLCSYDLGSLHPESASLLSLLFVFVR
jgi:hypothetical protein